VERTNDLPQVTDAKVVLSTTNPGIKLTTVIVTKTYYIGKYNYHKIVTNTSYPPSTLPNIYIYIWPKKNICVFTATCQKNLGSVGQD
jgi:hypothetical protein